MSVLLRPDGDLEREVELGQVQRIIADPERAALAAGLRADAHVRAGRRGRPARARDRRHDRHGADRPRRGHAPAVVPAESGTRLRRGFHHLHGRGGWDADEPDHQPALGHVGVRHRLVSGAHRRRHGLQRHAAVSPVGADDGDRRGDRRRRAPRDGDGVQSRDVLGGGPPLRRDRRVLHMDAVARDRRGAARSWRAPSPGAAVHRLGHAARPVAARGAALRSRQGGRVLRLDGGRRDPRQPARRQARIDGPSAAGQRRGPDRGVRRRRRRARARTRRVCARVRGRRGRTAARAGQPQRAAQRDAAARRVRARGRVAGNPRSVPSRRGRRLLARRRAQRCRPHRRRPRLHGADPRRAVRHPGRRSGRRLRRGSQARARPSSPWPR